MDYLLIYSQFSKTCLEILDTYPFLQNNSVCVDSIEMKQKVKELGVVSVPTLLITYNNKIIERHTEIQDIIQWIQITLYKLEYSSLPEQSQSFSNTNLSEPPQQEDFKTSLDDIPMIDETPSPPVQTHSKQMSASKIAEEMKRSREKQLEAMKPR